MVYKPEYKPPPYKPDLSNMPEEQLVKNIEECEEMVKKHEGMIRMLHEYIHVYKNEIGKRIFEENTRGKQ